MKLLNTDGYICDFIGESVEGRKNIMYHSDHLLRDVSFLDKIPNEWTYPFGIVKRGSHKCLVVYITEYSSYRFDLTKRFVSFVLTLKELKNCLLYSDYPLWNSFSVYTVFSNFVESYIEIEKVPHNNFTYSLYNDNILVIDNEEESCCKIC